MLTNNILSVPVLHRISGSPVEGQRPEMTFRGLLDVWDIMKHFTFFEKYFENFVIEEDSFLSHQFASGEIASILSHKYEKLTLQHQNPSLSSSYPPLQTPTVPSIGVSTDSSETPGVQVKTGESSLFHLMSLFTSGAQRVLMKVNNEIFSIFDEFSLPQQPLTFGDLSSLTVASQTDMLEWIYFNGTLQSNESLTSNSADHLNKILRSSLSDLGIDFSQPSATQQTQWWEEPLICVQEFDTTLSAFREMYVNNVKAVAVVNKDGQLIGALASKDLRYLTDESLPLLRLPVIDFLSHFHEHHAHRHRNYSDLPLPFGISPRGQEKEASSPLLSSIVYCHPREKLWEVIRQVLIKRVHRLWLVDPHSFVVKRMIPLTQLLQLFV